jgi:Prp8 binding protein
LGPGTAVAKRARVEDDVEENTMTLTVAASGEGQRKNALVRTIKRTSGLEAPIVSLAGAHGVSCQVAKPGESSPSRARSRTVSLIRRGRHWRRARSTAAFVGIRERNAKKARVY